MTVELPSIEVIVQQGAPPWPRLGIYGRVMLPLAQFDPTDHPSEFRTSNGVARLVCAARADDGVWFGEFVEVNPVNEAAEALRMVASGYPLSAEFRQDCAGIADRLIAWARH